MSRSKSPLEELFGVDTVIIAYTRAQALADGVLVDVTETAREAGITVPVALSEALWDDIRTIPEEFSYQDAAGRLWDCLYMFRQAARRVETDTILYRFILALEGDAAPDDDDDDDEPEANYFVKAVIGPGDNGEPVITLMKPGED